MTQYELADKLGKLIWKSWHKITEVLAGPSKNTATGEECSELIIQIHGQSFRITIEELTNAPQG